MTPQHASTFFTYSAILTWNRQACVSSTNLQPAVAQPETKEKPFSLSKESCCNPNGATQICKPSRDGTNPRRTGQPGVTLCCREMARIWLVCWDMALSPTPCLTTPGIAHCPYYLLTLENLPHSENLLPLLTLVLAKLPDVTLLHQA